jgi:hypothetical protein
MVVEALEERLLRQFYEWEVIGRGLYLCSEPVELEPAFRPFFGHYDPTPVPPSPDEARKPTFLSSLTDRVITWASGRVPTDEVVEAAPSEEDAIVAYRFDNTDPLVELQLALPSDVAVSKDACGQFLLSLGQMSRPVSFEIVATGQVISLQLACGQSDCQQIRAQLRACFPRLQVSQRVGYVACLIRPEATRETALVEFGLAREFMRPIRCYQKFEPDPLAGVIGALSGLERDECGVLQVLFTPVLNPWPESMIRAVTDGTGKPFFVDDRELVRQAGEKVSSPIYATSIRLAIQGLDSDRVWNLARSVVGTFGQFSDSTSNAIVPIQSGGAEAEVPLSDIVNRKSRRTGMLLNSDELLSIVHLPSPSVRAEKLTREDRRTKAAPAIATGHKLVLGENSHDSARADVTLGPDQRCRHVYVIGASGTGKSTLLLNMIMQDVENGDGIAVLDPHGDLVDAILDRVPEHRIDDVILFDPSDEQYPVGFNMLSAHSELERNLLASDLISVFRRLSTSWGDQMNAVFGNAILAFLESSSGGTLSDLRRFLVEPEFRNNFLKTVHDPDVIYYWQKEFPLLSGRPQGPILTRLDTFLRPKLIRSIVSQKDNRVDFASIMSTRKIFLAKLSQGLIGEENSYLLGTLLVAKINQMAMSRQALQRADRTPFYLYVDEFHNFVTPSMEAILSGARKYNLGLVLAHQNLQQLLSRDSDVASSVIANPYTRICFRLGDHDAKKLEEGFSSFTAKDLQNLGLGEAICRMERSDYDFNLKTMSLLPVERGEADHRREQVVARSREKYAIQKDMADAPVTAKVAACLPDVETQSAPVQIVRATPPPSSARPTPKAPSTPGRGGPQHKYLQELIKRWGESKGYRVTIEKQILGGLGSVDVALEKDAVSIACEISMTTSPEHEFGNLQKCLASDFTLVVMLSTEKKVLAKIEALAKTLPPPELERVRFFLPEELFTFIDETENAVTPVPQTVRGYKVKVSVSSAMGEEAKTKKHLIARTIMAAANRQK